MKVSLTSSSSYLTRNSLTVLSRSSIVVATGLTNVAEPLTGGARRYLLGGGGGGVGALAKKAVGS